MKKLALVALVILIMLIGCVGEKSKLESMKEAFEREDFEVCKSIFKDFNQDSEYFVEIKEIMECVILKEEALEEIKKAEEALITQLESMYKVINTHRTNNAVEKWVLVSNELEKDAVMKIATYLDKKYCDHASIVRIHIHNSMSQYNNSKYEGIAQITRNKNTGHQRILWLGN